MTHTSNKDRHASLKLAIAIGIVWVVWGSTYNAIRFTVGFVPPLFMMGARFLAAGVILFSLLRLRGTTAPTPAQWLKVGSVGALMLASGSGAVAFASQYVSAGLSATVIATSPIWFALFALLLGKGPTKMEWLGIVIGFLGAILLNLFEGELRANVWAALALFLGPIGWSGGSILSQKMGRDAVFRGEALPSGPMTTAIQLICSGTVLIVLGFVRGEQLLFPIPFSVVLAWVYLVIMGSLIAFSAYVYTLQHARPALVSSYAFVNPIVAIVIGYLLLGEVVSIISMIAMMIVLLGIVFITLGKR